MPEVTPAHRRNAVDHALSSGLKVPNARTRSAVAESEAMMKRGAPRFDNADEMFAELEEGDGQ